MWVRGLGLREAPCSNRSQVSAFRQSLQSGFLIWRNYGLVLWSRCISDSPSEFFLMYVVSVPFWQAAFVCIDPFFELLVFLPPGLGCLSFAHVSIVRMVLMVLFFLRLRNMVRPPK